MHVRLFLDIGHVMTKIDWEEPTKIKMCMYCCLLGLKKMTTNERVKPATTGPVADTNKLKMLCFLFYFVFESEKIAIMSALQWYLKNDSIFPSLFFLYFFSIILAVHYCNIS